VAGFDEAQARAALTTMLERLAKGPFVTLGIDPSATAEDVRQAFLTLTKRYHPAKFARMSGELQRQANEVFLQIRGAHDTIARSLPKASKRTPVMRHVTPSQGLPLEPAGTGRSTPPRGLTMPNARAPSAPLARPPVARPPQPGAPIRPQVAHGTEPRPRTPSNGAPERPTPNPLRPTHNNDASSSRIVADPKAAPSRLGSGPRPIVQPPPRAPTPAFGVRTPPVTPPKPQKTQQVPIVTPQVDETAELAAGQELMRRGEWRAARVTLQALANKVSASRYYRAMLAYAKAKETPTDRLVDEAIAELERFVQTEPSNAMAKAALSDLRRK
jgi:hypothetical protein